VARKKTLVTKGGSVEEIKKASTKKKKPRKLAPRPFGEGTLTKAGRHTKIVSALRSGSKWWKPKTVCLKEASAGVRLNKKTGRMGEHKWCASCKDCFPTKDVQVDHIKPVVGEEGFKSWDEYIDILWCEKDNMQVLCKPCHQVKTNKEKAARAAFIKKEKDVE
jgi:5-methylcytosine-specific restriction endonuclease McrA